YKFSVSDNSLLAIPSESIAVQPPAYIGPPAPGDKEKSHKYNKDISKDSQGNQGRYQEEIRNHGNYDERRGYAQNNYPRNNCQHYYRYNDDQKFFERKISNYCDYQLRNCDRQSVQMQNAKNQRFCMAGRGFDQQQFYTLPTRRAQREIEPPRSVTPDITRGLGRGSLSAMHMLARQGRRPVVEQVPEQVPKQVLLPEQVLPEQVRLTSNRKLEELETRKRLVKQQQTTPIVDVRNRFATPLSLSALGYRFFASSPVNEPIAMPPTSTDLLKHDPISPIGGGYGNGFESSTPIARSVARTVAERLALTTGNSPSPVPSSSGRSTPVQPSSSSGRNTPTNLILSPSKSTMSNEELFAAIHKSKKRLNIKDDGENMSPYGSMNSLIKTPAGNRHSWSPESQKSTEIPISQPIHSPSATSRLDFKRLLLQQSVKVGPTRLSAAEQLKLSRQQCQQQQQQQQQQQHHLYHHQQQLQQSSTIVNPSQTPLTKVMSPRSVWRFQTPRTDVLSSTIIEDTAAEEKAMKPSPENTSPISRLNSKRQLDLGNELANNLRDTRKEDDLIESCDGRLSSSVGVLSNSHLDNKKDNRTPKRITQIEPKVLPSYNLVENGANTINANTIPTNIATTIATSIATTSNTGVSLLQYSHNSPRLTSKGQEAVNAIESRRLSNQLARAQFLSSTPTIANDQAQQSAYFGKRFRARSESPKHVNSQNVATRSPSAPTLETAL
ncbi:mucin-4 isoform X4, partial [Vespula squamosa]